MEFLRFLSLSHFDHEYTSTKRGTTKDTKTRKGQTKQMSPNDTGFLKKASLEKPRVKKPL